MDTNLAYAGIIMAFLVGFALAIFLYGLIIRPANKIKLESEIRDRKDQFIALASHYLLNPITIIQTALATLKERDETLTRDQRLELYEAVERGQQRLWILAEQLILVGEIDQNNLQLHVAVSNLYEVVSGAIAAVDPFARAKRIRIHFEDGTQDIREARLDARRMKQAIIAVLDNAIKFSLEDSVINVRFGLQSGIFSISIEDHGIGMSEDMLAHISEKFYRGTTIYNFDYEGLGMGLHVAQAIVRMHQGNITFTSKAKQGTVASIQWPNV